MDVPKTAAGQKVKDYSDSLKWYPQSVGYALLTEFIIETILEEISKKAPDGS